MHTSLIFPPATYYHMPYLAPYLLKGHLHASSPVTCRTDDANIRFFHALWTGGVEPTELDPSTPPRVRLSLEYLAARGASAWEALRDLATYRSTRAVARASRTLRFADLALSYDLRHHGLTRPVPTPEQDWPALVDRLRHSVLGRWLERDVRGGRYRDCAVVCLSAAYLEQLAPALLIARLVKEHQPGTVVVIGGNAVTHVRREVLAHDTSFWHDVDYAVAFQGEEPLTALLTALAAGATDVDVDGVARIRDGAVTYRRAAPQTGPPAGAPDFTDLDHLYPTPEPIYPLLTSKGCYWGKCAFCTHHEGYGDGYFRLGADAVDDALKAISAVDGSYLYFVDEAIPPREINDLARRLAAIADVPAETATARPTADRRFRWTAEARVDKPMLTEAAVRSLVDSGCVLLVNGIEAGSQRVADLMRKGIRLTDVERHAELLKRAGIPVGWMFFIGFPGETDEEARATFEMIRRNRDHISYASVGTFALERDSPVWNDPTRYRINLLEAHVPYALAQNYTTADAQGPEADRQRVRLDRRLAELHAEFADLDPIFERAVDRSFAMFMAVAQDGRPDVPDVAGEPVGESFRSPSLGRTVTVDLDRWKMRVNP
ncbi:Radical SAM superfamily enzyme YgiQ, UPF0313 family [Micromonospora sediminicola]|uniref:Radical SAM superfamily enzyme YgiQ, UPF0313 family n=1 Tax=Micromonospora sediminicola TaxID=946078 RepID=A0A1A9BAL6_9ACTN|nr:radical SAM protein [Micromonospora sediminicola]SBT66106.1 Radical SAM superfamily enzyme YgiQ, UPF0313 family [Micromonospora sediminicola]